MRNHNCVTSHAILQSHTRIHPSQSKHLPPSWSHGEQHTAMDPASLGLGVVALLGVTTAAGNLSKAIWLAWRDDDAIVDEVNWMRLQIRQSANTLRTAVEGLQDMVETNPNSKAVRKIKIRRIISDMKDESSFLEQDMERIRQILLKSSSFSIWRKIDWQLSKKNRLFAIAQRFSLFQNGVSLAYLLVQTDILNSLSQQNDQETCKFLQGLKYVCPSHQYKEY